MKSAGSRRWTLGFPIIALGAVGATLYGFGQAGPSKAADEAADAFKLTSSYSALVPDPISFAGPQRVDYDRVDQRLQSLVQGRDMVGLAVAIVENGQIRFVKGYGVTEAGGAEPVNPHTVFRWASLSKGVASTLVASLAESGMLSLTTPVAKFGTTLRLPGGAENRVTVEDVLAQRTGIVRNAYDDKLEQGMDPAAIRGMLASLGAYCAPATCYSYQNVAYDTSAEIVQKVAGKSYADVVQERLFAPLGMTNASIGRAGLQGAASWARPHNGQHKMEVNDNYYRVPAAGGVNSSIFDLAKWMRAQMGAAPQVLSDSVLERVHKPMVLSTRHGGGRVDAQLKNAHYALGWREYEYLGHKLTGHRGAVNGYRSLILFDNAQKSGIAMLWNSQSNRPVGMQLEVMDMLYQQPFTDWMDLGAGRAGGGGVTIAAR